MRKGKKEKFLISVLVIIFISFPVFGYSQEPLESQVQISISAQVGEEVSPPSPPAPPWAPSPPPPAIVVFEGRAYPNAFLTILKDNQAAATFFALPSGLFKKELTGIRAGIYTFGVWAEDTAGRKSVTLNFTVSILEGMTTTISGIFISPTIEVGPIQVERGDDVNIFGQAFPESEIKIFVASSETIKETKTDRQGKWDYKLNTALLSEMEHTAKARAFFVDGEYSPFSHTVNFLVLKSGALVCRGADLNFDDRVNIIDFSILLYFWGQRKPANICVDINQDGIVNIVDFSIMMYWWMG
ncbi:MAG: dockerin type I repeat-containing protein [Candidatus Nealsonbacteria bacterium]|nr:dockerin type I repeat-containing protein [Candidatus Nealsonbacteria bacterium]